MEEGYTQLVCQTTLDMTRPGPWQTLSCVSLGATPALSQAPLPWGRRPRNEQHNPAISQVRLRWKGAPTARVSDNTLDMTRPGPCRGEHWVVSPGTSRDEPSAPATSQAPLPWGKRPCDEPSTPCDEPSTPAIPTACVLGNTGGHAVASQAHLR